MSGIGLLEHPGTTDEVKAFFDEDLAGRGYVMNLSRPWAYQPHLHHALFDEGLSPRELAMADWARKVARDPNGTSQSDVQALRDVGFSDAQIFAMTVFVALRLAFSTVNDALGVKPDAELRAAVPDALLEAVTFGRPID